MKNQYFVLYTVIGQLTPFRSYVNSPVRETASETIHDILDEVVESANDDWMLELPTGAAGRQMIEIISISKLN